MSCVEQKKGRYVSDKRKAPLFSAGDCKGQTKKGLDGKMWVSVATNGTTKDKKIIYRWKRVTSVAPKKKAAAPKKSAAPKKKTAAPKKKAAAPKKSAAPKKKADKDIFQKQYIKRQQKLSEVEKKIINIQSKRDDVEKKLDDLNAYMRKEGTNPLLTEKKVKMDLKLKYDLYKKSRDLRDEIDSKKALARSLESDMEEIKFLASTTGDLYTLAVVFRKLGKFFKQKYRGGIYSYFNRPMFNMETNEMIIIEPPNRGDLVAVRCKIGEDFVKDNHKYYFYGNDRDYKDYDEYISAIKSSTLFEGLKSDDMKVPKINLYDFHDEEYEGNLNAYLSGEGSDIIYAMAKSVGFKYVQGFQKIEKYYLE